MPRGKAEPVQDKQACDVTSMEQALNTLGNVNVRTENCVDRVDKLREWYNGVSEPVCTAEDEKHPMEIGGQLGLLIASSNRAQYLVTRLEEALSLLEEAR